MGDETVRIRKVTDEAIAKALASRGSVFTSERVITGVLALLLGGGASGIGTNAFMGSEVETARAAANAAQAERTEMRERHSAELEQVREENSEARKDIMEQCKAFADRCEAQLLRCTN